MMYDLDMTQTSSTEIGGYSDLGLRVTTKESSYLKQTTNV